jgi:replicative DNA helicase
VALFLRHLWATDGSVRWDDKFGGARIYYASTSRRLVDDVQQLLLRVGVNSRIAKIQKAAYRDCWHLWIDRAENQVAFLTKVGVHGARSSGAQTVLQELTTRVRRPGADTVPREVWNRVERALVVQPMSTREFAMAANIRLEGSATWTHAPGRRRLHRVAALLDDRALHGLATSDVFWDKIVKITSIGEQDVFDGTVTGTNNFVAQGISVHNSLEQDADMVILLNRPDAFERDDPRGGEADLILAKHRNGPTKTVTVAHQLHLSRFANMAR